MRCPSCGGRMKRNGATSSGRQRWRCKSCGASTVNRRRRDAEAERLSLFLGWLLPKGTRGETGAPARTFRSATSRFWRIWPVSPVRDEAHRVVHVDGIWLKRKCVVLIALAGGGNVLGWHLARSESSGAWSALVSRIAPPDVVVADGGGGIERARREHRPAPREILGSMPTNDDIGGLYAAAAGLNARDEAVARWGDAVAWSELHFSAPWGGGTD